MARVRVSGTLTGEHEWTGEVKKFKITPFEMDASVAWVDLVDTAIERTVDSRYAVMDDDGLCEEEI